MLSREFLKKALHDSLPMLGDGEYEKLAVFSTMVLEENKKFNLTSITNASEFAYKHILDSLMFVSTNNSMYNLTIADAGTGAGFPGIPLAISCPEGKISLIESSSKKCAFLSQAISALKLKNVQVINSRAEILSKAAKHKEKYDFVLCRALASFSVALELNAALIKRGGSFCFYAGRNQLKDIMQNGDTAAVKLGLKIDSSFEYSLPESMGEHSIVFVKKLWKTDLRYPRDYKNIRNKPL